MSHRSGPVRFDVTALGELVIDMVPARQVGGARHYAAKPGGAPGNVAAGVSRLGLKSAMLSRVGPGLLGELLIDTLAQAGVDTDAVRRAATEPTALTVVSLGADGERDFALYRDGCADAGFAAGDIPRYILRASRVLHVGSLWLATPVSAAAQRLAVSGARAAGAVISADVNFRPALWRDRVAMRATGIEAVANADVIKVSTEELLALTGSTDIAAGAKVLWQARHKLLAVTKGAAGAELFTADYHVSIPGFATPVVDTIGCGDAFMAALLAGLLARDFKPADETALSELGRYACAAGAVMAGVAGAMEQMPRREDIAALLDFADRRVAEQAELFAFPNGAS